jgi:predicted permease
VNALVGIGLKALAGGAIGYWAKKRGVVGDRFAVDINNLLLAIVAPCAMLSSASQEFSETLAADLGLTAVITAAYFLIASPALALISMTLPLPLGDRRMFASLCVMANTGFIGFPVAYELFGSRGLLCATAVNLLYNLVAFTAGIRWLDTNEPLRLRGVLLNPPLVSSVIAIGLFFAPFRLPSAVQGVFDMIGGTMTPLALMIVGLSLAETYLPELVRNLWGYAVSAIRLLVLPSLVWAVLWLIGVDGLGAQVAVVMAALPCGTFNVILGARYDTGYRFAVHSVVQSNVLMFATLPLILLLPL